MMQRLIVDEFDQLTPEEEEDLYHEAFWFDCGKHLDTIVEHESYSCSARAALKAYSKEEDFWTNQKSESEIRNDTRRFEVR